MKLICGKCKKEQEMKKIFHGKKDDEFSWWCPYCEDKICPSSVIASNTKVEGKDGE